MLTIGAGRAHVKNPAAKIIVPDRFFDNHKSGYAVWTHWNGLAAHKLGAKLQETHAMFTLCGSFISSYCNKVKRALPEKGAVADCKAAA